MTKEEKRKKHKAAFEKFKLLRKERVPYAQAWAEAYAYVGLPRRARKTKR